jgi:hypothetical protein
MGLNFGSTKSKSGPGQVSVWKPQEKFLTQGLTGASDIYGSQKNTPAYMGDTFAGIDPALMATIKGQATTLGNQINPAVASLFGQGSDFMGQAGGDNLASLMTDMNDREGALKSGNTFASSKYADDLISATNNDIWRGVSENDLPQARMAAIGSGNSGSSRLGAREGIITRGAEDRMGANAANVRGGFFDRGVSEFNNNIATRAGQLSNLFNQGQSAFGTGADLIGQGQGALQGAAAFDAQNRQGYLDQSMQAFDRADQRPWDLLNRFWQIAGGNIGQGTSGASKSSGFNFGITAKPGGGTP